MGPATIVATSLG